jgi:hypothetical protein
MISDFEILADLRKDEPIEPASDEHRDYQEQIRDMDSANMAKFAKFLPQNRIDLWNFFHKAS